MICASTYNSHQVHKLSKTLQLERIGTSVNPSLSLVNHSCDSNSIRCNVNKSSILVAVNHIPMGQEITESYSVHFRFFQLHYFSFADRENTLLKGFPRTYSLSYVSLILVQNILVRKNIL